MVFGGKASARPKLPQPPTVDQLLEDLKAADLNEPVYNLSRELLGGLIDESEKEEDLSDPNLLYKKVVEYVGSADSLEKLGTKISQETKALQESHQDLKKLAEEVQNNLKRIKDSGLRERSTVEPSALETVAKKEDDAANVNKEEEEEDLC